MKSAELRKYLENPANEYRVVPFGFINHYPVEEELRRQIRDFAGLNFGGVMVHPRDGLLGGYLDRHWEETIAVILDEAKKQGLQVWLYDELHYPSGNAGGRLREKFPEAVMQSLELVYEAAARPAGQFDKLLESEGKYLGFKIRRQEEYPDYLDGRAMAEFVRLSYTWYADRFKADFGTVIPGEFTDNACANFGYYRRSIPWTGNMEKLFREKTGIELDTVLPSLFLDTPEKHLHRLLFWRFLAGRFMETFVIPIERECGKNGIAATGHYCLENGASEHVRQLGDRYEIKRHQQIPGVDFVGKAKRADTARFPFNSTVPLYALTASPAYFLHGSRVLCECFGCTLHWGMTMAEIYRISGTLAALGIDIFVPHGLYYSIAGSRKRECIPDFYHNTLRQDFGEWALRIARLNSLTACAGRHLAEVAMLYPVTSQQAAMELPATAGLDHGEHCREIDRMWLGGAEALVRNAIPFEVIDEALLEKAEIRGGELLLDLPRGGVHPLRILILPSVWIVKEKTYAKLRAFAASGGMVVALGEKITALFDGKKVFAAEPDEKLYSLETADPFDEKWIGFIRENRKYNRICVRDPFRQLVVREWIKDRHYYAMIHNFACQPSRGAEIKCDFAPLKVDLASLGMTACPQDFTADFAPGETMLLTVNEDNIPVRTEAVPRFGFEVKTGPWEVGYTDCNCLRLTKMISETSFDSVRRNRWTFEVADLPDFCGIALDMEPTSVENLKGIHPFYERYENTRKICRAKAFVNGEQVVGVSFGKRFDRWLYEADISKLLRIGTNTIEIIQPCVLREQSMTFPEPVTLFGLFGVEDGRIVRVPGTMPSPRWDNTVMAWYSGTMSFTARIPVPAEAQGKNWQILFGEVYDIMELSIDGHSCGRRVMSPYHYRIPADLTGKNELELTLRITNTPSNRWETVLPSGIIGDTGSNLRIEVF